MVSNCQTLFVSFVGKYWTSIGLRSGLSTDCSKNSIFLSDRMSLILGRCLAEWLNHLRRNHLPTQLAQQSKVLHTYIVCPHLLLLVWSKSKTFQHIQKPPNHQWTATMIPVMSSSFLNRTNTYRPILMGVRKNKFWNSWFENLYFSGKAKRPHMWRFIRYRLGYGLGSKWNVFWFPLKLNGLFF